MRLYVFVLEARGLPAPRPRLHGGVLFYAKVTAGKQRFRTRAVEAAEPGPGGDDSAAAAAAWNEEFVFAVGAEEAEGEEFEVAVAVAAGAAERGGDCLWAAGSRDGGSRVDDGSGAYCWSGSWMGLCDMWQRRGGAAKVARASLATPRWCGCVGPCAPSTPW